MVWPGTSVIFAAMVCRPKRASSRRPMEMPCSTSPASMSSVWVVIGRPCQLTCPARMAASSAARSSGGAEAERLMDEPGAGGPDETGRASAAFELLGERDRARQVLVHVAIGDVRGVVGEAEVEVGFEDDVEGGDHL